LSTILFLLRARGHPFVLNPDLMPGLEHIPVLRALFLTRISRTHLQRSPNQPILSNHPLDQCQPLFSKSMREPQFDADGHGGALVSSRLPAGQQAAARRLRLGLALFSRMLLLGAFSWVLGLTRPLFALSVCGEVR
jgi:hypothetical protein